MKINRSIGILILLLFIISSCQKGEVPGNNMNYIGVWKNTSSFTDQYQLTIKADGTDEYIETHSGSYYKISGGIYFDGYNFKIGTNMVNKKFKTDSTPQRVTLTTNPYTYYSKATFNGVYYTYHN